MCKECKFMTKEEQGKLIGTRGSKKYFLQKQLESMCSICRLTNGKLHLNERQLKFLEKTITDEEKKLVEIHNATPEQLWWRRFISSFI